MILPISLQPADRNTRSPTAGISVTRPWLGEPSVTWEEDRIGADLDEGADHDADAVRDRRPGPISPKG